MYFFQDSRLLRVDLLRVVLLLQFVLEGHSLYRTCLLLARPAHEPLLAQQIYAGARLVILHMLDYLLEHFLVASLELFWRRRRVDLGLVGGNWVFRQVAIKFVLYFRQITLVRLLLLLKIFDARRLAPLVARLLLRTMSDNAVVDLLFNLLEVHVEDVAVVLVVLEPLHNIFAVRAVDTK